MCKYFEYFLSGETEQMDIFLFFVPLVLLLWKFHIIKRHGLTLNPTLHTFIQNSDQNYGELNNHFVNYSMYYFMFLFVYNK